MGCGGSKRLHDEDEKIPDMVMLLLRTGCEEIRKGRGRKIAAGGPKDTANSSKKELLDKELLYNGDIGDTLNSIDIVDDKSSESSEENSLKVAPEPEGTVATRSIKTENAEITKMVVDSKPDEAKVKVGVTKLPSPPSHKPEGNDVIDLCSGDINQEIGNEDRETATKCGKEQEEAAEDHNEEGRLRHIFPPGSPSFRVYLSDNKRSDEDKNDETEKKFLSESSNEAVESVNSNEECLLDSVTIVPKKRGKKGMKLKRMLPNPKTGARKNLLLLNLL